MSPFPIKELEQAGNKIQHKVVVCDKAGEVLNQDLVSQQVTERRINLSGFEQLG